jgi:hypothetical protein
MNTYPAATVADATGASLSTLQRYTQPGGHIAFQPCDGQSRGSGDKRQYSTRRIIQTAITIECSRLGIAPSRGAKAAFEFSDRGGAGRAVGELFPLGATLLVGLPTGENKVINIPPDLSISDVLSTDTAAFIINCNNVVAKVTSKLSKS